jgi:hypothetical protein
MRSLLWGILAVTPLPASVVAQTNNGQALNPIMLAHGGNESQIAVVMWSAFGSGCKSVEEMPSKNRNVLFNILPKNALHVPKLVFDLSFPAFSLNSGHQVEKDNALELYSECALRFAIRGQPGKRLKKIEGLTKLEIQKDKGASLLVFNELRFGQFGSDEEKLQYDEQTEIKKTILDLNLSKDLAAVRSDGGSSCGTDQVLFYDFTLFAKKTNKASQVSVTFHPPKRATVRLEYEKCS